MTRHAPLLAVLMLVLSTGTPSARADTAITSEQQVLLERLRERQQEEHARWRRFGDVEVD